MARRYGFDADLLEGVDNNQLIEATQHVMGGINNGEIDQQWIQDSLTNDNGGEGYYGAFVLILVLFILLVIVGAGFGLGG